MAVPVAGRAPQVLGVSAFFLALSTITTVLRAYCRLAVVKNFGYDDIFAVMAWIFFATFTIFAFIGVHHGTGQHASDLPFAEIPIGLKWWWSCEPVYVLSNMALKLSISIMLLRIAVSRLQRNIIYAVIIVVELYSAFFFLLFVLQCRPAAYFWTRFSGGKGTCINPNTTVIATYIYSAISCWADWTLGIVPIFMVWDLQMNIRTKLSVAVILALGAVASTATIVRIPYVHGLSNSADFLYATTDVAIWSICETGIGITASAIATLRPLFRTFFATSKLFGDSSGFTTSKSRRAASGYMQSRDLDELRLRSDIGGAGKTKEVGVTTIIGRGEDLEMGSGKERIEMKSGKSWRYYKKSNGSGNTAGNGEGNWDGNGLRDDTSSEEGSWVPQKGITKTTVTETV